MSGMTNKDYIKKVERVSPNSKLFRNMALAFLFGGAICVVGELVSNGAAWLGVAKDDISSVTSVVMIFLGVFLTAINVYGDIAKHGGAGTLVPITGFANGIAACAMEFKSEGFVSGMASKMFIIAGPVLVFGEIASFICGIVYYIASYF